METRTTRAERADEPRRTDPSAPPRVLLANDRLGYGSNDERLHGAGRLMIEWTRSLRARGVDVTTVILREPGPLGSRLLDEGLPFVFLRRHPYDPRTLTDFLRLIRERDIDVLHLQAFGASTFGRLAALLTGTPCLVHVHADYRDEPKGYPWFVRVLDRLLAPVTDSVIAISEAVEEFAVDQQGFREDQVDVRHSPVDLDHFRPPAGDERRRARRSLGLDPSVPVAACVGRFDPIKGVDVLVEAWNIVRRRLSGAVLVLAGGPGPGAAPGRSGRGTHERRDGG